MDVDELKQAKIDVKSQKNYNSCYICLCGAILMACESWKVVLLNNMDIEESKMSKKSFNVKVWFEQMMFNNFIQ
jgi:hypothetical protein